MLCVAAATAMPAVARAATFGGDDRVPLPLRHKGLGKSIGLFFSVKAKTVCSAFCVADNVIATASHCIFKTSGEAPLDPADFRFGPPNATLAQHARVAGHQNGTAGTNVLAGNRHLSIKPPIDATQDWALVRLDRAACRGAVLPVAVSPLQAIEERAAAGQVFHAAFHRDRLPWKLLYAPRCPVEPTFDKVDRDQISRDFKQPDQLLLHRCGTGGASSGSPLLLDGPAGPVVIGINVGTYVQSRIVLQDGAVLFRSKPEPIANTAVHAAAFAGEIAPFASRSGAQELVSRFNRSTSSGDSGAGAVTSAAADRRLRQSRAPASAKSNIGVPHNSAVDRSTGGRSSTKVP
jgi:protease YdgD